MPSLRIALKGLFSGEDLRRALLSVAGALQSHPAPPRWHPRSPRGSAPCYEAVSVAGDAELRERVEVALHIEDGRPEERGPIYRWEVVLCVLTADDVVTLRAGGGGGDLSGCSLMMDVELTRAGAFDTIRAELGRSMPELHDLSDLADVVASNVEALGGSDVALARAWLARARADHRTASYWPTIRALQAQMGLLAPSASASPPPVSAPPGPQPPAGDRPWTGEERTALEAADAASLSPLTCPVCGGEVKTGPGKDQWHYAVWCTGCSNTDDWCWK